MNKHQNHYFSKTPYLITLLVLGYLTAAAPLNAAGIGDPVPSCSSTAIQYSVSNIVPSGFCYYSGATISMTLDVNLWNPQTGYNLSIGYTAAGNPTLRDIKCLNSPTDLDATGCGDYDGSGTSTNPVVTQASLNVSCGLPTNNNLAPVDFYLNYDTNAGGTNTEVVANTCLLETGISFPYRGGSLAIRVAVINDDGGSSNPGNWTMTANFGNGADIITGNGYYTGDGNVFAGDYVITGSGPPGYVLDNVICQDSVFDDATSTLAIKPNDRAECLFTYNDIGVVEPIEPLLTLLKSVVNDDGGLGVAEDFNLSINGTEVTSGASTTVASGETLVISELDLPGYKEGVWNCYDNAGKTTSLPNNGRATGTNLILEPGSDVVCTIENNDIAVIKPDDINLAINKTVTDMSPSIGDVVTFNLEVRNTGSDNAFDVTAIDIMPAGLSYVAGSISGGNTRADSDPTGSGLQWTIATVAAGSNVTVSYQAIILAP